jgi:hypothetical protein
MTARKTIEVLIYPMFRVFRKEDLEALRPAERRKPCGRATFEKWVNYNFDMFLLADRIQEDS